MPISIFDLFKRMSNIQLLTELFKKLVLFGKLLILTGFLKEKVKL
jgi:hypothetical protein